jgi:hypothetical protein
MMAVCCCGKLKWIFYLKAFFMITCSSISWASLLRRKHFIVRNFLEQFLISAVVLETFRERLA